MLQKYLHLLIPLIRLLMYNIGSSCRQKLRNSVVEASSTSTKPIQKQSFSSGSVIPTGSWRESYFTTGKPNSLVIPQQTGSNPLVILRCCSVGYSTMHSISKLHRGWEWKSSLTHYPTTTTNKYPLVRFRCINVKMTREFGWVGITRWQESYSTSPIPPSYLVVWLGLFVSPMPPSYLVAWFILFVINQVHLHIGCLVYLDDKKVIPHHQFLRHI